jgi:hypothetical protein
MFLSTTRALSGGSFVELSRVVSLVAIVSAFCTRCVTERLRHTDADPASPAQLAVQYDVIVDYGLHMYPRLRVSR